MKTTEKTALSIIRGTVDSLLTYPLCGRATGELLGNAIGWRNIYMTQGLSFSGGKITTETLRDLTAQGYLASDGKTKAQGHKLTWAGLIATQPDGDNEACDIMGNLATLAAMPEHDLTNTKGIEGFRLVPEIVAYFKTFKNPEKMLSENAWARMRLTPLMAMGWVQMAHSITGGYWAVHVTEQGREALRTPPDCNLEHGQADDTDAWEDAYTTVDKLIARKLPPQSENTCIFYLSAGAAWAAIGDYTAAKAEKELKTAQKAGGAR